MKLGDYPVVSLREAREKARLVFMKVSEGADPAEDLKIAKGRAPATSKKNSVAALVELYIDRRLSKLKSGNDVARYFERFVLPAWGSANIDDISRRDVIELVDSIVDAGTPVLANRTLAHVKTFFNWCIGRDVIDSNPADRVPKPGSETSRNRVLTKEEIRWFWLACERVGYPWGHLGQFLLLTGQRLNEIAKATHEEIGKAEVDNMAELTPAIFVPSSRTKNGRPNIVPLSGLARDLYLEMPNVSGKAGYIFTTNGKVPVSGFHKGRQKIADAMQVIASHECSEEVIIPHWGFHDLRRTFVTGVAQVMPFSWVVESLVNHVSGRFKGVTSVYNHYKYFREKVQAVNLWSDKVKLAISGER